MSSAAQAQMAKATVKVEANRPSSPPADSGASRHDSMHKLLQSHVQAASERRSALKASFDAWQSFRKQPDVHLPQNSEPQELPPLPTGKENLVPPDSTVLQVTDLAATPADTSPEANTRHEVVEADVGIESEPDAIGDTSPRRQQLSPVQTQAHTEALQRNRAELHSLIGAVQEGTKSPRELLQSVQRSVKLLHDHDATTLDLSHDAAKLHAKHLESMDHLEQFFDSKPEANTGGLRSVRLDRSRYPAYGFSVTSTAGSEGNVHRVGEVREGGAGYGNVRQGDAIRSVNGVDCSLLSHQRLLEVMSSVTVANLEIEPAGLQRQVSTTLRTAFRPEAPKCHSKMNMQSITIKRDGKRGFGISLSQAFELQFVSSASVAAGLRQGDIIDTINGIPCAGRSLVDVQRQLSILQSAQLQLYRKADEGIEPSQSVAAVERHEKSSEARVTGINDTLTQHIVETVSQEAVEDNKSQNNASAEHASVQAEIATEDSAQCPQPAEVSGLVVSDNLIARDKDEDFTVTANNDDNVQFSMSEKRQGSLPDTAPHWGRDAEAILSWRSMSAESNLGSPLEHSTDKKRSDFHLNPSVSQSDLQKIHVAQDRHSQKKNKKALKKRMSEKKVLASEHKKMQKIIERRKSEISTLSQQLSTREKEPQVPHEKVRRVRAVRHPQNFGFTLTDVDQVSVHLPSQRKRRSVQAASAVFVATVSPDGLFSPVEKRLFVGDQVLAINHVPIVGYSAAEAVSEVEKADHDVLLKVMFHKNIAKSLLERAKSHSNHAAGNEGASSTAEISEVVSSIPQAWSTPERHTGDVRALNEQQKAQTHSNTTIVDEAEVKIDQDYIEFEENAELENAREVGNAMALSSGNDDELSAVNETLDSTSITPMPNNSSPLSTSSLSSSCDVLRTLESLFVHIRKELQNNAHTVNTYDMIDRLPIRLIDSPEPNLPEHVTIEKAFRQMLSVVVRHRSMTEETLYEACKVIGHCLCGMLQSDDELLIPTPYTPSHEAPARNCNVGYATARITEVLTLTKSVRSACSKSTIDSSDPDAESSTETPEASRVEAAFAALDGAEHDENIKSHLISLVDAVVSSPSALQKLLGQNLKGDEALALVRICQMNPANLTHILIEACARHEVEQTTHSSTLFRGNTTAIRCLVATLRLSSSSYLQFLISDLVERVKDYPQLFDTTMTAKRGTKFGRKCDRAMASFLQDFFARLGQSLPELSVATRAVLYYVRREVAKKFPNLEERALRSIFFLRLVQVALVTPDEYDIVDGPFDEATGRAFAQITRAVAWITSGSKINPTDSNAAFADIAATNQSLISHFLDAASIFPQSMYGWDFSKDTHAHTHRRGSGNTASLFTDEEALIYSIEPILTSPSARVQFNEPTSIDAKSADESKKEKIFNTIFEAVICRRNVLDAHAKVASRDVLQVAKVKRTLIQKITRQKKPAFILSQSFNRKFGRSVMVTDPSNSDSDSTTDISTITATSESVPGIL